MKGIKQVILSCLLGVGALAPMQAQQVQGFVHGCLLSEISVKAGIAGREIPPRLSELLLKKF